MPKSEFSELNGFYAGFMSGTADQGLAVFIFRNGMVVGADFSGTTFDGEVLKKNDDDGFDCKMSVSLPGNGTTIQGVPTGPGGVQYTIAFAIPHDFAERGFFNVSTPLGGVNVRLQKVRDLGAVNG